MYDARPSVPQDREGVYCAKFRDAVPSPLSFCILPAGKFWEVADWILRRILSSPEFHRFDDSKGSALPLNGKFSLEICTPRIAPPQWTSDARPSSPQDSQYFTQAEMLVVDEAAAIPLPLIEKMFGPYLILPRSFLLPFQTPQTPNYNVKGNPLRYVPGAFFWLASIFHLILSILNQHRSDSKSKWSWHPHNHNKWLWSLGLMEIGYVSFLRVPPCLAYVIYHRLQLSTTT